MNGGRRLGGRGGFTLVELVAVVAIVALVAVLAVQRVGGYQRKHKVLAAVGEMGAVAGALQEWADDMEGLPRFCRVNPYLGEERYEGLNARVHLLFCATNVQSAAELGKWREDGLLPDGAEGMWDEARGRGWRGPYLQGWKAAEWPAPDARRFKDDETFAERGFTARYGRTNEVALMDPWGNPYVVQFPDASHFAALRGRSGADREGSERWRWPYARVVSAGPDGRLETPRDRCAGRAADGSARARGDDIVMFLGRADVHEDDD